MLLVHLISTFLCSTISNLRHLIFHVNIEGIFMTTHCFKTNSYSSHFMYKIGLHKCNICQIPLITLCSTANDSFRHLIVLRTTFYLSVCEFVHTFFSHVFQPLHCYFYLYNYHIPQIDLLWQYLSFDINVKVKVKGQGHSNRMVQITKVNFSHQVRIGFFWNFGKW